MLVRARTIYRSDQERTSSCLECIIANVVKPEIAVTIVYAESASRQQIFRSILNI